MRGRSTLHLSGAAGLLTSTQHPASIPLWGLGPRRSFSMRRPPMLRLSLTDYRAVYARECAQIDGYSKSEASGPEFLGAHRPLGRSRSVPERRIRFVASYLYPHKFYVGHKLAAGLHLRATDSDWSAGAGPEVHGPIEALTLTLSGRFVALDELDGEGAMILRDRAGASR
jgi:hypothetical protein